LLPATLEFMKLTASHCSMWIAEKPKPTLGHPNLWSDLSAQCSARRCPKFRLALDAIYTSPEPKSNEYPYYLSISESPRDAVFGCPKNI
jgi:hypothetical protein